MSVFKFKQFSVQQDRCAMKVGTDGILLGAWAGIDHKPEAVLDIGAGTGLIALMLAQRSEAPLIDAIEIDEDAYEECVENFEASPWADRLFCYHAGLDEFVAEIDEPYDLIVSNPPFYSELAIASDTARAKARHNQSLPFDELVEAAASLLSENGIFALIIPYKEEMGFTELAESFGLYPRQICRVRGNSQLAPKRSLIEFGRVKQKAVITELAIESSPQVYSEAYTSLTGDFYINM